MTAGVLTAAYLLDWAIGDPEVLPHPVRFMGRLIALGERRLNRPQTRPVLQFATGTVLAIALVCGSFVAAGAGLFLMASVSRALGVAAAVYVSCSVLATRSLLKEAAAVHRLVRRGDIDGARIQVSRIVGRDTVSLSKEEVVRAAIETLAESASDGIIAPLLYLTIGGPVLAFAYKAVNTLDSMIGHREPPYFYFGKFSARLDDVANFVPARITALLIAAASIACRADWRRAIIVWRRDASKHSSPNAGRPEAAMAGALRVRLGGINWYGGAPHAGPFLGEPEKPLDEDSLRRSLQVVSAVSVIGFVLAVSILISLHGFTL